MSNVLLRPRSIVGATAWGIVTACAVFIGLNIAEFVVFGHRTQHLESIAVGDGYSIALDAKPSHLFLAEYEQSIRIYGGDPRGGELLGRVAIPVNPGGRVRIGILVPRQPGNAEIVLADRGETTRIDLATQKVQNQGSWRDADFRPIGIISGESYPLKFIPCSVWWLLTAEERDTIVKPGDELQGFCE